MPHQQRLWITAILVTLTLIAAFGLWLLHSRDSADEQLTQMEAARAVPDDENAANLYNELLQDAHATSLLDIAPDFLAGPIYRQRLTEPWPTKDHPELATWIEENQYIINKLGEVTELEQCRFPISIEPAEMSEIDRAAPMRQWAFLVTLAANNDLGEERFDAAVTKWRCLLQMADHLHQQPVLIDHMIANAIAGLALKPMNRFVATGDLTEAHLHAIETLPLAIEQDWGEHRKQIDTTEDLRDRKMKEPLSPWDRVKFRLYSYKIQRATNLGTQKDSAIEKAGDMYQEHVCTARGLRLLVALRRHKNTTGHWPMNLEEVTSSLPPAVLIDPLNDGPFVYTPAGDTFTLYSRGRNGIDENARRDSSKTESQSADDITIWPPQR